MKIFLTHKATQLLFVTMAFGITLFDHAVSHTPQETLRLPGFVYLSQTSQNFELDYESDIPFSMNPPHKKAGGLQFDQSRLSVLKEVDADKLLDYSIGYTADERKAGMGVSVLLAFRTPKYIAAGDHYLLSNGDSGDEGFSIVINSANQLGVRLDNQALYDTQTTLIPDTTYVFVTNYNAVTHQLEIYNANSKECVQSSMSADNLKTGRALLLGGKHAYNTDFNGIFYEVRIYDRAISEQQIFDESAALLAEWGSRAKLDLHLSAGSENDFVRTGNAVQYWIDQSGSNQDAFAESPGITYAPVIAKDHKASPLNLRESATSLIIADDDVQDSWLDFSETGNASANSGLTVLLTFRIGEYVPNWNDILGADSFSNSGLAFRLSSLGSPVASMGGANLQASTELPEGQVVTYALRYNATSQRLEFWNSYNDQTVDGLLSPEDFSSSLPLRLGGANNDSQYFNGDIYELKVYTASLTDEELVQQKQEAIEKWQPTMMPIEVLGHEGLIEEATVFLEPEDAENAVELYLLINNIPHQNKGSVKINYGEWLDLNHDTVIMAPKEAARGGMSHGGFSTLRIRLSSDDFLAGMNRIQFRFNESDGLSNGFRIVEMNILDQNSNRLLGEASFRKNNPELWEPPFTDQNSYDAGKKLWYGVTSLPVQTASKVPENERLWTNYKEEGVEGFWHGYQLPPRAPMKASCTDCHTHDGRDMEMFSYSNRSIIERSKFHGLTETEGKQIASYLRRLIEEDPKINRAGRPWNPPYQPGPEVANLAIEDWAAGAGLKAVLEHDSDLVPILFGSQPGVNPTQAQVNQFFQTSGKIDSSTIPLAIQFPDWKHWLPRIHPMDAFTNNLWENGIPHKANPKKGLQNFRNFLEPTKNMNEGQLTTFLKNNLDTFFRLHLEYRDNFRFWWQMKATGGKGHWRSSGGTAVLNLAPGIPREFASSSLAKLAGVKQFEIYNEFRLQDKLYAVSTREERKKYNMTEKHWLAKDRYHIYMIAPHFIAAGSDEPYDLWRGEKIPSNSTRYLGQTMAAGQNESTTWYELQAVLTSGQRFSNVRGPVHYNYQMLLIGQASGSSGVQEGMRFFLNATRMYQTMLHNRINDRENGWNINESVGMQMRNMAPFYVYTNNRKLIESADHIYPGLSGKIANAHFNQFLDEMDKKNYLGEPLYDLEKWPRMSADYSFPESEDLNGYLDHISKSQYRSHGYQRSSWADRFWETMQSSVGAKVDSSTMERMRAWLSRAWPNMPWSQFDFSRRSTFDFTIIPKLHNRNRDVEITLQLTNTGNQPWDANDTRIALWEDRGFVMGSFPELVGLKGQTYLNAWGTYDGNSVSHFFRIADASKQARVTLHMGNPKNGKSSLPSIVSLYRNGVFMGHLTGAVPLTGQWKPWSLDIPAALANGNFELRVRYRRSGSYLSVDALSVTETGTNKILYEDHIENPERWLATPGDITWGLQDGERSPDAPYIPQALGKSLAPGQTGIFKLILPAQSDESEKSLTIRLLDAGSGWFGNSVTSNIRFASHAEVWANKNNVNYKRLLGLDGEEVDKALLKQYAMGNDVGSLTSSELRVIGIENKTVKLGLTRRRDNDLLYTLQEAGDDFIFRSVGSIQPNSTTADDGTVFEEKLDVPAKAGVPRKFYRIKITPKNP